MDLTKAAVFLIALSFARGTSVSYQVNVESREQAQPTEFQVSQQVENSLSNSENVGEGIHRPTNIRSSEGQRERTHQVTLHHGSQTQIGDSPESGYRGETTRAIQATEVLTEQYRDLLDRPRGSVTPQAFLHFQQEKQPIPYAHHTFYKPAPVILETGKLPSLPALAYSSAAPADTQALTYNHDTWYQGRASLRQSMQTPHARYIYGHFL